MRMIYEVRSPATAKFFFWYDGVWLDVIRCGDLSIKGWVQVLRNAGFPIAEAKR